MYSRRKLLQTTVSAAAVALIPRALNASILHMGEASTDAAGTAHAHRRTVQASTRRLNARTIYELATTRNICLTPDGSTLQLDSGEVFQDDGPASGYSYKPNVETLSSTVWILKRLVIDNPRAGAAKLLLGSGGTDLKVTVNGHLQTLGAPGETNFGQWQIYTIDPAALKAGMNDIVISGVGQLWIARADDSSVELPRRSARSTDSGVSWNFDRLGPEGNISGEYSVRVFLDHHRSEGSILLPVMDVANLSGNSLAPPVAAAGPLQISTQIENEIGHHVSLRVRSGETYVPDKQSWSEWIALDRTGRLKTPRGRYIQVEVTLATGDPLTTPRLREISIETAPTIFVDWTRVVKVRNIHNEQIIRTSIPFLYEPFTQPRLKELRTRYHLDEVVKGAKTELELIVMLAGWAARQWKWGEWHLATGYPAWDALDILSKGPDGKPVGGFCEQYDLVFLQAAESFGLVGRQVSISNGTLGLPKVIGHEPTEVWSNQFGKWIYIDATYAAYAVDSRTGVPLSLLELRQRQIQEIRGKASEAVRIVHLQENVLKWRGLTQDISFAELRLIPRSNFLEQKSPLPLNAGYERAWFWSGYYVWTDAEVPAELLYPNRVTQHGNFEWTLNQAHYVLEAGSTPDEIRVHLDTETPGLETFLAEIDGAEKRRVDAIFPWKLHAGSNSLKVWPRNIAGRDGIASWIELEIPART